jgi:lipopolysaccharide biosynthesis protein
MSSSQELMTHHLQSYFLVFEHSAMKSEALANFWKNFLFYKSKARIIQEYEIGLARMAMAEGWNWGAWVEFDREKHKGVNSTLYSWDTIIEKEKFPFLKTEVLRLNRAESERVPFWADILKANSSYPVELIREHTKRRSPPSG